MRSPQPSGPPPREGQGLGGTVHVASTLQASYSRCPAEYMAQEARVGFPLSLALPTAVLTLWATASSTGGLPCPASVCHLP